MNRLSKVVNVSKALGLTIVTLGVNVIDKVKSGVEVSREVYSTAKERVLQRENDRMMEETISSDKHDPYVGYTDEDMKRDNIKAGIGYSK